ncbi:hypothetical protein L1987_89942 [Smallanthus sonchifolius]|nr:hypothetical protein L1987_89942 [Smallanthus sonchifolius]
MQPLINNLKPIVTAVSFMATLISQNVVSKDKRKALDGPSSLDLVQETEISKISDSVKPKKKKNTEREQRS